MLEKFSKKVKKFATIQLVGDSKKRQKCHYDLKVEFSVISRAVQLLKCLTNAYKQLNLTSLPLERKHLLIATEKHFHSYFQLV